MKDVTEIVVTLPGGRRVDAQIGPHVVHTDQPVANGGEDTAPTPFALFLASIAACAGIFVQGFCAARQLPTDAVRVRLRPGHADDGTLVSVDLDLELPESFPEKYRDALVKVVDGCSVKKAIAARPGFNVRATRPAARAA